MAATLKELQDLHRLVVRSLATTIQLNTDENLPTDAATLGAAIKMLKDNNVTADPADADDLEFLRKQLTEAGKARKDKLSGVLTQAGSDLMN